MTSLLNTGRMNLGILKEAARRELLRCLDRCVGSKAVVCDECLIGQFGLIAEYALLKDHDVIKMFPLRAGNLPRTQVKNVVFLTRAKPSLMEIIADYVKRVEAQGNLHETFHICFVPRKSLLCEEKLKEHGVYGTFCVIEECCIELFPFDTDLLSMEMDSAFRECYLEHDMTSMFHVSKAIMTIQAVYGIIPTIYGKGTCAKHVYELMLRMRREMAGNEPQVTPQIDALLLLDRNVDLLSPLVTQLTYEGLIDEIFGIHHNSVKLPAEKFHQQEGSVLGLPTEPKHLILHSSEELHSEIRDKHFNAVGPILSKKAKLISAQFEERHNAKTVGEMKQFVSKLPQLQTLRNSISVHTTVGQLIKEVVISEKFQESQNVEQEFLNYIDTDKVSSYIEECIAKQENLIKVLKLVCMQSIVNSGLKPKILEYYKREILQTYGYQHMLTLHNLEKLQLLRTSGSRIYPVLRKTLRCTVDDVNEQNPSDIAYVHSGYAPLSVRLAQFLAKPGWHAFTDILNILPGPTVEETQQIPVGLRRRRNSGSSVHSSTEDQKVTLVFFLGGCTYAEIAALRFLAQLEDAPTDYIIATTKIINSTSFIQSLMESVEE